MTSKAYDEGSRAHDAWWSGRTKEYQCPYPEDTTESDDWYDGWGDAADCLALPAC